MSENVRYKGVVMKTTHTLETLMEYLKVADFKFSDGDDIDEALRELSFFASRMRDDSKVVEYILNDGIIYEVLASREDPYDDIFEQVDTPIGTEFITQFYNGSCCLSEMVQEHGFIK